MVFFVIYLAVIVYITLQDLNTDFDKEEIRKEFDSVFDPVKMVIKKLIILILLEIFIYRKSQMNILKKKI